MHDSDFSPRLLGLRDRPPRPLPRLMVGVLALLLCALFLWAWFGRLDIVARASGRLVPRSRVQVVQPLDRGRVAQILVDEGDRVEAGQPLIRMDPRLSHAEMAQYRQQLALARLQLRRINATLSGQPFKQRSEDDPKLFARVRAEYESERQDYTKSVAAERAKLDQAHKELAVARDVCDRLQDTVAVARKTEAAYAKLSKSDAVARVDLLDRRRARIKAEADLASQRQRIEAIEGRIREAQAALARLKSKRRQRLVSRRNNLMRDSFGLEARWQKQRIHNGLLELRAPRAGRVKNLAVHTEGSVVPAGTVLLSIVPRGEPLRAEVLVSNRDVGFVHPGQDVRVKLAAYPFQRFGTIHGTVRMVSPDASNGTNKDSGKRSSEGRYRATIALDRQRLTYRGEPLDLRSGMQVLSEIKLGERSVLEYILSPIASTLDYAGKER